jgi:hypothetical protein
LRRSACLGLLHATAALMQHRLEQPAKAETKAMLSWC